MQGKIEVFASPEAVAEEAARRLLETMAETPGKRFSLALSGGGTPQKLYLLLSESPWRERVDWSALHIFLADERFVPWDHPDSNWRMIRETLLDRAPIPSANAHPMPVSGTPEECARIYEEELRTFFGDAQPRFDLILLGMGPDGHTASLFPGHVHPEEPWVVAVHESPKPPPVRLSLNLPLINQANRVWFIVTGQDKGEALAQALNAEDTPLPAGKARLSGGRLTWLLDEQAWREAGMSGATQ
jgi:6-phosphogluconolactonase